MSGESGSHESHFELLLALVSLLHQLHQQRSQLHPPLRQSVLQSNDNQTNRIVNHEQVTSSQRAAAESGSAEHEVQASSSTPTLPLHLALSFSSKLAVTFSSSGGLSLPANHPFFHPFLPSTHLSLNHSHCLSPSVCCVLCLKRLRSTFLSSDFHSTPQPPPLPHPSPLSLTICVSSLSSLCSTSSIVS